MFRARQIASFSLLLVAAGTSVGCGGDGSEIVAQIDARLAELRADEAAMFAALEALPEIGPEHCEVPTDTLGPLLRGATNADSAGRVALFERETEDLRARAGDISRAGADRWLGRYSGEGWMPHESVLFATSYRAPRLQEASYDAGEIVGRVVLWDHARNRTLCTRDVVVVPTDETVRITTGLPGSSLSEERRSRTSALGRLRRRLSDAAETQTLDAMRADAVPGESEPAP